MSVSVYKYILATVFVFGAKLGQTLNPARTVFMVARHGIFNRPTVVLRGCSVGLTCTYGSTLGPALPFP